MPAKILIVDDSLYMRTLIKETLSEKGFEIIGEAGSGEAAIDLALELQPDLITLDNILPDMLGSEILKTLKKEDLKSKIIMISAVGQQSVMDEALRLGASDYLIKPFTAEKLQETVKKLLAS